VRDRTPAQLYALAFGIVLTAVGILGFFVDSGFGTGSDLEGDEFIVFEVNGWHNIVHLASGLIALWAAPNRRYARGFAIAFGPVYAVVTIWGFVLSDSVFGLIPVNAADNVLHLGIAAIGILAAGHYPAVSVFSG
jgi:hypothetical protein